VRSDGREQVSTVEGVGTARAPPALVIKDHCRNRATKCSSCRQQKSVVWANERVTAPTANGDRSSLRANTRVNHGNVRANR
jgi:hypothetical protein